MTTYRRRSADRALRLRLWVERAVRDGVALQVHERERVVRGSELDPQESAGPDKARRHGLRHDRGRGGGEASKEDELAVDEDVVLSLAAFGLGRDVREHQAGLDRHLRFDDPNRALTEDRRFVQAIASNPASANNIFAATPSIWPSPESGRESQAASAADHRFLHFREWQRSAAAHAVISRPTVVSGAAPSTATEVRRREGGRVRGSRGACA